MFDNDFASELTSNLLDSPFNSQRNVANDPAYLGCFANNQRMPTPQELAARNTQRQHDVSNAFSRLTDRQIMRDYRTQVAENTLLSIQRRFDRCCHR
jgi:hypothetical protein